MPVHIFSHPRSGSTLLIRIINNLGFANFVEVFHPNEEVFLNYAQKFVPDQIDLAKIPFQERRTKPWEFIAALTKISCIDETSDYVFKTFVGHLKPFHLFSDDNPADTFFVHERSLLHSYASDLVAKKLKSWGNVDTTSMIIDFNFNEFKSYFKLHYNYLYKAKAFCKQKRCLVFSTYSKIKELDAEELSQLLRFFLDFHNLSVNDSLLLHSSLPVRQNSSNLLSDKFSDVSCLTNLFGDDFALLNAEIYPSDQANILISNKLSTLSH